MSNTRYKNFRSFLTERFTTVAVEVFGEVESIVEAYRDENKRLRSILHMVLSPEILLEKIDVCQYTGETTNVRARPPELNAGEDVGISEPQPKKAKEEQSEYKTRGEPEQQQGSWRAANSVTADCLTDKAEEDSAMPYITDSFHIEMVEWNPESALTLPVDAVNDGREASCSEALTHFPSRSEDSASESQESQKHKSIKKSSHPLQKTMLELPKTASLKSSTADPADCQAFLGRLTEAYKDLPDDKKPLMTTMDLTEDVEYVDSAFGKVPKGSPLSYQCPMASSQDFKIHADSPPQPLLPLSSHALEPVLALPVRNDRELEHMNSIQMTWEAAHSLEQSTRGQKKEEVEELRKLRLTSRFMDICKLRSGPSHAQQLILQMHKGFPVCRVSQVHEELKAEALRQYCWHLCVNWSPCGLVVHPNAPWLGALPDGVVYDPSAEPSFGLVRVDCTSLRSFMDCSYLICRDGALQLRRNHRHYWHMQAEMMVTGTSWSDLVLLSQEDILVQRVYRDKVMIQAMKKKLDNFFFLYYLPSLFYSDVAS